GNYGSRRAVIDSMHYRFPILEEATAMLRGTRGWQRFLWLMLATFLAAGKLSAADIDNSKLAGIRERMQQFVDHKDLAGAVTVVSRHDGIVSLEAVGSQNLEAHLPMRPDTLFRI